MTAGQKALADGFAVSLAVHGQTYVRTSDGASVLATSSRLTAETPHMPQGEDRAFAIIVADAELSPPLPASAVMPASRIKKGDELTKGSKHYRVIRADFQEGSAMWNIMLSPTF